MQVEINGINNLYEDEHITSPISSFIRMFQTALGDRIMLPDFGSQLYTLVDKNFDQEWVIDFKRFSLECCFDSKGKLWDKRVYPKEMKIKNIDTTSNVFKIEFEIEFFTGERYDVRLS